MSNADKKAIITDNAPRAIGPYSQGVLAGNILFVSGQLGIDPQTGEMATGGVEAETRQALENIKAILKAADLGLKDVTKCDLFLADLADFETVNRVYSSFFTHRPLPARVTIEAKRLPKDARIEISCMAFILD